MDNGIRDKVFERASEIGGAVLDTLGIAYKREGRAYVFALRDERTPSAKMLIHNGYTTDFGDGWHGDLFSLWQRRKGCDFPTALAELARIAGVSEDGVYTQPVAAPASTNGSAKRPRKVTNYEYTDEEGKVLYRHVRIEPGPDGKSKTFSWEHPDGKGGWVSGQGDGPRVPYCLPDILMGIREEGRVFFAEGEKDVHTLQDWGFPATSSKDWRPEFAAYFKGAEVFICEDNDAPGKKTSAAIADALRGVAKDITVICFPDVPAGGDVTDWANNGGTKEKFLQRIARAKSEKQIAAVAVPSGWALPDLSSYGQPVNPAQWAIEDMFTRGTVNMVYGQPASLKTMLLMEVCAHVAAGYEWMGRGTFEPRPVIWINADTPHSMLIERRQAFCRKMDVPHEIPMHMLSFPEPAVDLTSPEQRDFIKKLVLQTGAWVVVLDCLREVIPYDVDENSSGMGAALKPLKMIAAETKATFVVIHHETKDSENGQFRGSSAIAAALDSSLRIVREEVETSPYPVISVEPRKQREFPVGPKRLVFKYEHRADGRTLDRAGFELDGGDFDPKVIAERIVFTYLQQNPGATKNSAEDQLVRGTNELGQKRFRDTVSAMMMKGHVKSLRGERGGMELYITEKATAFYELSSSVRHSSLKH